MCLFLTPERRGTRWANTPSALVAPRSMPKLWLSCDPAPEPRFARHFVNLWLFGLCEGVELSPSLMWWCWVLLIPPVPLNSRRRSVGLSGVIKLGSQPRRMRRWWGQARAQSRGQGGQNRWSGDLQPSAARERFRDHPCFDSCAEFCERWDQSSFDLDYPTEPLSRFEPMLREVFGRKAHDPAVLREGFVSSLIGANS